MSVSVTVVQPDPTVPLDRFAGWLQDAGASIDTVNLWEQDMPAAEAVGDGVIVLGGRDNCLNGYDWMPQLHALLRTLVERDVPVLGICLGHQILADAFGGTVELGLEGEEGAYAMTLTDAGTTDPILGSTGMTATSQEPFKFMAAESHHDVVTVLPQGAVRLAGSERYENQAFRLGSAVGVQFHPEASPELVGAWAEGDGHDPAPLIDSMRPHDEKISAAGRAIAEAFAAQCVSTQCVTTTASVNA